MSTPMPVDDPLATFARWHEAARTADDPLFDRFVLASVNTAGRPSARMLSYRPGEGGEFRFFTNHESRKGQELAANPNVAAVFYWHSLRRQVRLEGAVHHVAPEASDAYFHSRPEGSRVTAVLSAQSRPLTSFSALRSEHAKMLKQMADGGVALERPPHWGGYELTIAAIELWQSHPHRLAERHRYERMGPRWVHHRLAP